MFWILYRGGECGGRKRAYEVKTKLQRAQSGYRDEIDEIWRYVGGPGVSARGVDGRGGGHCRLIGDGIWLAGWLVSKMGDFIMVFSCSCLKDVL